MPDLKPILLVEDNPKDLELTLAALEQSQLANEVVIVRDGAAVRRRVGFEAEEAPFATSPVDCFGRPA